MQLNIFEIPGLVVDPNLGRGDPAGKFSGLKTWLHQGLDEVAIGLSGQPFMLPRSPVARRNDIAIGVDRDLRKYTNLTMEPFVRKF